MRHMILSLQLFAMVMVLLTANLNAQWTQIGGVALDLGSPPAYDETAPPVFQQIQINPVTGELYVIGLDMTTGSTSNRPTVRKFISGSWSTVGVAQFTDSEAYGLDMAFHPTTGEPYVSFISTEAIPHISVMRFDGNNWVYVGSKDFEESFQGKETRIAIHPTTETPYVVFERRTAPGLVQLSAMSFDGNDWIDAVPVSTPYIQNALGSSDMDFTIDPTTGDLIVAAKDKSQASGGGYAASIFISSDGINWSYGTGTAGVTQAYGGSAADMEISFAKNGRRYFKFRQITGGKYYVLRGVGSGSWTLNGTSFSYLGNVAYALKDTIPHMMIKTGNDVNQGFDLITYKQPKDEPFRKMGYPNTQSFPTNGYTGQLIGGFSARNDLVVNPATDQLYSMHTELSDDADKRLIIKVFRYENSPPTGISLNNNVIEGSRAIGTVIGTFSTADVDTYDIHSYTLQSGGADNSSFTISEDGELLSAEVFDENVKSSYDILVRTTDDNLETYDQAFTITVSALDVAPSDITLDNNQQAEGTANTAIGFFSTFDANTGEAFTYTKVSGAGSDDNASFSVSSATGALSRAVAPFDYDVKSSYSIRIRSTETDNSSNFIEKVFTIEVIDVNAAPVLSSTVSIPNPINVTEDETFTYELPADLFEDEENGPLFYSIYTSQPPTKNAPASWITIDELTGTITGTPGNSDVGTSSVHYIHVTDAVNSAVASNAFAFNVQNVNDAPTVSISNILVTPSATEDTPYTSNVILLSSYFNDQDAGDALTYTITNQDDTPVDWLTLDINMANGTGTITGTPTNEDVGIQSYKVTATDQSSASVSTNLQLTINNTNDAPTLENPIPDQAATPEVPWTFQFAENTFNDPDPNATLTYQATQTAGGGLPAWMSFNGSTRTFSGTPPIGESGNQYSLRVTATDAAVVSVFDDFLLNITPNNVPTVINPIGDQSTQEESLYSFQFPTNTFSDADGDPLTYTATLTDTSPLPSWINFDESTRTFEGTPDDPDVGTITIRLSADDAKGGTVFDDFSLEITPVNDTPVQNLTLMLPEYVVGKALFYFIDTNTFTDAETPHASLTIDVLDESLNPVDWLITGYNSTLNKFYIQANPVPNASQIGTNNYTLRVFDTDGAFLDIPLAIVIVANTAPQVSNPISTQNATEDVSFTFQFAADVFTDADNDPISYSAVESGTTTLPSWITFESATRTFSGTPTNEDVGTLTISLTGADSFESTSTTFDIVVANVNDVPTVANTIPDQAADEDVLFTFQFEANTFEDVDGDVLIYSIDGSTPLPTWLSFEAATRTFSGTPSQSDIGIISIMVIADDGNGASVNDSFQLEVVNTNDAPIVDNPIPNQLTDEDAAYSYQFASNTFSDPDQGDVLSYSIASSLPGWISFDGASRTFTGTPSQSDVGSFSVMVVATDQSNATVHTEFSITVNNVNDAPTVANPIPDQSADEDASYTFQFAANAFADEDGDALTYAIDGSTPLPSWLSFEATTLTFSGTPSQSDIGIRTITVTADDGNGGSVNDSFELEVLNTNDTPVVDNPIPNQLTEEDAAYSFQFASNTFSDPDQGDVLSYSIASNLPGWITFDGSTRTFSGTPAQSDVGSFSVMVVATDQSNATVSTEFSITVDNVNDAPTLDNPIQDVNAVVNVEFSLTIPSNTFGDEDIDDELILAASQSDQSSLPEWLTFDASTWTFTGTPKSVHIGTAVIRVVATDGNDASISDEFIIEVIKALGVTDESSVLIYPNPFYDYLMLDLSNLNSVESIQILSLEGKVLLKFSVTREPIDLSHLAPGNYLISIENDGQTVTQRITKSN